MENTYPQELSDVWSIVYDYLKDICTSIEMSLWFRTLKLVKISENEAILTIDNDIKKKFIETRYLDHLSKAISAVIGREVTAVILSNENEPVDLSPEGLERILEERRERERIATENFEDRTGDPSKPVSSSEYTFENFIVGSSNRFAYAAAYAVAQHPADEKYKDAYNPLFIYGPSGIGKTHLMYAITHKISMDFPHKKILYVKGEEFTNQLIDSLAKKNPAAFREKYRKADVLLIDDIQFIAGKESTQEEFFHTFNALYEDHRQIILTSDRPPKEIKTLENRLRTRFESGLITDIQPPDFELRLAILKNKAEQARLDLPLDALNFLAEHMNSNIRQIEGVIKKIAAMHLLNGSPVTLETVREMTADFVKESEPVSEKVNRIIMTTAKKFGISTDDIRGTKRNKAIVLPRHVAIYIIRSETQLSLNQIGQEFGRDHTTVLASISYVTNEIAKNPTLESQINDIINECKG